MVHIDGQRAKAQKSADDLADSLSEAAASLKAKDEEIESAVVRSSHVSCRNPGTVLRQT